MGAPDILARLSALGLHITREGTAIRAAPKSALTDEARSLIRTHKVELLAALSVELSDDSLPDPAAEARRQSVPAMLRERPGIRYAVLTDTEADPEVVLLTLAIRDKATCELRIPKARYDPFLSEKDSRRAVRSDQTRLRATKAGRSRKAQMVGTPDW